LAVGDYADGAKIPYGVEDQGVIETLSGGSWRATTISLPPDINGVDGGGNGGGIFQVSCVTSQECVAVGTAVDDRGEPEHGVIEELNDGTWSGVDLVPPDANRSDPQLGLSRVSCEPDGTCVVVGNYADSDVVDPEDNLEQGVIETRSAGIWTVSSVSSSLDGYSLLLDSLSCAPNGVCATAAENDDHDGRPIGQLEISSSGKWNAVAPPTPSEVPAGVNPEVYDVSCGDGQACIAVVNYVGMAFFESLKDS
jgi:hypothetical protein